MTAQFKHAHTTLFRCSLPLLLTAMLLGCANPPFIDTEHSQDGPTMSASEKQQLQTVYQTWQGVPYQLGGQSKAGIDCSAFMQVAMQSLFNINLPRTTALQSSQGRYVAPRHAGFGDLVFFKTGWSQRHVGLYLGENQFMHASTSRGVMISRLDNPYWASHFWQFRRLIESSQITPIAR